MYDGWAKDNPGWSYNELMKYFKKSETNIEPQDEIDKEYHGYEGPMMVGRFPFMPDLALNILDGAKEMGMRYGDPNGRRQETFTIAPIMTQNGEMASPYKMYLRPALKRPNLRVLLEAHVVRIHFDKSGTRATGVEFQDKWGKLRKMKARKEIILSGGVVGSAQLLQLSGKSESIQIRCSVSKEQRCYTLSHFRASTYMYLFLGEKYKNSSVSCDSHLSIN